MMLNPQQHHLHQGLRNYSFQYQFYAGRAWFVAPQHRVIVSLAVVPALVFVGLLISTVGFLGFIFPLIYPDNLIYVGVSVVETKLYASCVLTALNSRAAIMKQASSTVEVNSSRAELAKEVDSERGHGQSAFSPDPNAAWNF
ncbi:hypothetical protein GSI_12705 [Ganoderma sinense ZZ0214-1]|uniref:Uncharacterized protein n=1 Tax=Ganoderma sinense ZZ0214-1 TaxID=1077348 RepID=A0A2G8RTJ1_9APHY|nr:hypothetical protein GSI_12705 [Ganoderma sinense ZZ0214-1]